ncbi:MAG: tRNA (adenosine(37)-N6)-dimethylallyltransferase MiaA [Oscillospiraceae bacterium]
MAEYNDDKQRYLVICGPTACGKSALALRVAQMLGGEIVCGDSMQIYRGLKIGTAAPSARERGQVPHLLYGITDPAEGFSVGRYVDVARGAVRGVLARGAVAIVCGGTGQYIDALCDGLEFCGGEADEQVRLELREEYDRAGAQPLLAEIASSDPLLAEKIDVRNVKRLLRAVELLRAKGMTTARQTELSRESGPFGVAIKFVLWPNDREALYARCNDRVDAMFAQGLPCEAEMVWNNRDRFKTAAQAIGYKELFPYFEGTETMEGCVENLKRATRRYAKRQLTWFRRETGTTFLDIDNKSCEELALIVANGWQNRL